MRTEDVKVVELGSVSADTRGLIIGAAETEFGHMLPPSLYDD